MPVDNPQVNVSPWQNTTIGPDLSRRPLEAGEDWYTNVKVLEFDNLYQRVIFGFTDNALAITTLCLSPPESSLGYL